MRSLLDDLQVIEFASGRSFSNEVAAKHHLRVATIFTYGPNGPDPDTDGMIGDRDLTGSDLPVDVHKRDRLKSFVADYNAMYQTKERGSETSC